MNESVFKYLNHEELKLLIKILNLQMTEIYYSFKGLQEIKEKLINQLSPEEKAEILKEMDMKID